MGAKTRKKTAKSRGKPARKSTRPTARASKAKSRKATKRKKVKKTTTPKPKASRSRRTSRKSIVKRSRVKELRAMLEARRAEILEEIKRARQDSLESDRTSFPEVGDLVSASVEKERAFEYGEAGVNALREIDLALEKLEEGTYGICESCGKPISLKRLRIMPSARLCIRCKAKEEARKPARDRLDRYPSVFAEDLTEE